MMPTPEAIANKIVGMIADGRMSYPLVEAVGYWIVQYSIANPDSKHKIMTFAHSIIENIEQNKEKW